MNKTPKFSLIIIFIIVLIAGIAMMNNTPKEGNDPVIKDEKKEIYINDIKSNNQDLLKLDADVKTEKANNITGFDFIKDLKIPSDFLDTSDITKIYVKDENSNVYDKLYNYAILYNATNERYIQVSFSDTNKPLRDYYLGATNKKSKINNTQIEIRKHENIYVSLFKYNNINFDIETNNITQDELIILLESIIK